MDVLEALKSFGLHSIGFILLISVMMISGILRDINAGGSLYAIFSRYVKNRKWLLALLSAFFGIVPIPARILATCGVLD